MVSTLPPDSDSVLEGEQVDCDIVTFDRPPISEVVAGVGFTVGPDQSIAELGRYWGTVAERFPRCELTPPIPAPGFAFPLLPSPRLVLRSSDGSKIIQLQENWFLFNWVKDEEKYPRFRAVYSQFRSELAEFLVYLETRQINAPTITQLRLNYVNHIPKSDGWRDTADISKFFPDFLSSDKTRRHLSVPKTIFFRLGCDVAPGRLDIEIKNGVTRQSSDERLIADFGVSSFVQPFTVGELDSWFASARKVIVRSFVDLTSEHAHDIWGLNA